jgi:hypothetical protein
MSMERLNNTKGGSRRGEAVRRIFYLLPALIASGMIPGAAWLARATLTPAARP